MLARGLVRWPVSVVTRGLQLARHGGFPCAAIHTVVCDVEPGAVERPTTVVFIPDPLVLASFAAPSPSSVFEESGLGPRLRGCGFPTCEVAFEAQDPCSVDGLLKVLGPLLRSTLHVPPVLIAVGFGGYLAQKYLESYAAASLVLLSSVGPVPAAFLQALDNPALSPSDAARGYIERVDSTVPARVSQPATTSTAAQAAALSMFRMALLADSCKDPLLLEQGVAPALVFASSTDSLVLQGEAGAIVAALGADSADLRVTPHGGAHFSTPTELTPLVDSITQWIDA